MVLARSTIMSNLLVKHIFRVAILLTVFAMPSQALANGAVGVSGFTGNELIVTEGAPFSQFIVDEEVELNFDNRRVTVNYHIENKSSVPVLFKMLFPIESNLAGYKVNCSNLASVHGSKSWDELIDFSAKLNATELPVKVQVPSAVIPKGEYAKFSSKSNNICAYMSFDVRIDPGPNSLLINYHLLPEWFDGDGIGKRWGFTYSIWPAKNWVSNFRNAQWRVVIPQYSDGGKYQFDNWYMSEPRPERSRNRGGRSWRKWDVNISGPGTRKDSKDVVEYTATNYVPAGELNIRYSLLDFYYIVESAYREISHGDDKYELWIQAYLQVHPYIGDKMCYQFKDLQTGSGYMGFGFDSEHLSYLRNEIFARKGYIFESEQLKLLFSKLSWYTPKFMSVKLNEIEEWNIKLISEVEKGSKSWHSEYDVTGEELRKNVYERMKASCPKKSTDNVQ